MSPLLFNIVFDVFSVMLVKGSQVRGRCPNFTPWGVIFLQNVDDTLLFVENNTWVALNLNGFSLIFEFISSVNINYHKKVN